MADGERGWRGCPRGKRSRGPSRGQSSASWGAIMRKPITCTPKRLPRDQWVAAARTAARINPVNHPPVQRLARAIPGFVPSPAHLAVLTSKYWGAGGTRLTVAFLDGAAADL